MNDYATFLERKAIIDPPTGLAEVPTLNPMTDAGFIFPCEDKRFAIVAMSP